MAELMSKIATEPAPDIRQLRHGLSDELAHIVARLLRKSPQDRYQDGNVLAKDLSLCVRRPSTDAAASHDDLLSLPKVEHAGSPDLELRLFS